MPIMINLDSSNSFDHHLFVRNGGVGASQMERGLLDYVDIGLINNMPDSALVSTERQVFDLLQVAAGKRLVRLHLFTLEATPRAAWGRDYVHRFYRGINDLFASRLDGIIVTGAEPTTKRLTEEPFWDSFTQVISWAKENTLSSIYSCLAVHGAVLHLDGVERRPLAEKCIGVFAQRQIVSHPLLQGVPERLGIPHSRWNEVREDALLGSGYEVLTKSDQVGVDCFVKQLRRSLLVCFQGHPEYEAQSLLGEYRRDIGRYLRREIDFYPTMPQSYFGNAVEEGLIGFKRRAVALRDPKLLADFPTDRLVQGLKKTWWLPAERIYRNWISYLSSQKLTQTTSLAVAAKAGGFQAGAN